MFAICLYTSVYAYVLLCLLMFAYICHLLMHICLCLCFLMFAYVCLCISICLLMGYDISEGIFYWNYEAWKKGKCLEEDLCI
jgi:hypothetical protein